LHLTSLLSSDTNNHFALHLPPLCACVSVSHSFFSLHASHDQPKPSLLSLLTPLAKFSLPSHNHCSHPRWARTTRLQVGRVERPTIISRHMGRNQLGPVSLAGRIMCQHNWIPLPTCSRVSGRAEKLNGLHTIRIGLPSLSSSVKPTRQQPERNGTIRPCQCLITPFFVSLWEFSNGSVSFDFMQPATPSKFRPFIQFSLRNDTTRPAQLRAVATAFAVT
jgi:hypothetical protein